MTWSFDALLSGPTLPGAILLGICGVYWLMLILGAIDLHLFDFHLPHFDAGHTDAGHVDVPHADVGHGHGFEWGLAALRFLNLGDVPVMIWATAFALAYCAASLAFDGTADASDGVGPIAVGVVRAGLLGLVGAKLLTQPLRGRFTTVEPNAADTLVGRVCVVTTSEVTATFGQARLDSDAAPLLLHVRAAGPALKKHDLAEIVAYDPDRRTFLIEPVPPPEPRP